MNKTTHREAKYDGRLCNVSFAAHLMFNFFPVIQLSWGQPPAVVVPWWRCCRFVIVVMLLLLDVRGGMSHLFVDG